ncbi:MAG: hypothetical protein ACPG47_00635 [Leucothrix sp.]
MSGLSPLHAKTPSGTVITNQAEIAWFDTSDGSVKRAYSNVSSVVVAKQYSLLLESDNIRHTTESKKVDFPHRLTNTGNTDSFYEVRVKHKTGDSGDLSAITVFTDSNGNGVTDAGEPEWATVPCIPAEPNVSCYKTGRLDPSELVEFVVVGFTPSNALTDDEYQMNVRTFPWHYDQIIKNTSDVKTDEERVTSPEFALAITESGLPEQWVNNDVVDIIDGAVLTLVKTASPNCGVPVKGGEAIRYQIGFTNTGDELPVSKLVVIDGDDVSGVILEDKIPPNVALKNTPLPVAVPNQSIVLVQLVQDEDTSRWTRFSNWNGRDIVSKVGLYIPANQMQPGQSGQLNFSVTINQNVTTSTVYNQAKFDLVDGGEPEFVSNSVCTTIEPGNTRDGEGNQPGANLDATVRFLTPTLDIKRDITQNGGVPDFANDAHFVDADIYRLEGSNNVSGNGYSINRDGVYIEMKSSAVNISEDTADRIEVTVASATGDTVKVMLLETGPNTGVFRSVHQIRLSNSDTGSGRSCPASSSVPNYSASEPNCVLNGSPDGNLTVTATVSLNNGARTLTVLEDAALIDPLGIVFDSAYNTEVEGAQVWIRNEDGTVALDPLTDKPYAPQVTGPDGKYQFPFLYANQNYYLDVVPPAQYTFPSKVPSTSFVSPANGPGRMVNEFSYGKDGFNQTPSSGVFTLTKLLIVDIPLDPELDTDLSLSKSSSLTEVGIGGTISYTIKIKNHSGQRLYAVKVKDTLPRGFNYVSGSATLNDKAIADPAGAPRPNLTFTNLPFISGAADGELDFIEHSLKYSVRTTAGAIGSDGVNSAIGSGKSPTGVPIISNMTKVRVKIQREGVLEDSGIIFGKVFVDADCNNVQNGGEWPIGGVKLYLEDGTWVITDANGQYSLYGLESHSHVIKIDPITLPEGIFFKPTDNRQMADPNSRLVDLTAGEFHRADFVATCPKENQQEIFDEIKARNTGQTDWMLQSAQKYDPSKDNVVGSSVAADGDLSSGRENKPILHKGDKQVGRSLTTGYSIQTAQFIDKVAAETALTKLPEAYKNKAFVFPVGDFYTVRIGFDLEKKTAKAKLREAELGAKAKVVPTIYEQMTDEVADRLETPRGIAVMTPAKEVVKTITNQQAKSGAWLWPKAKTSLDGRFMVVVRKGVTPTLMVNGKAVPKSQMGEQIENRREKAQVVAWYGVKLDPGVNKLKVVAKDSFGNKRVLAKGDFTRPVSAHTLKITSSTDQLPADGGRSYLPITIKLLDKNGYLARGVNFVTIEASDGQWVERDIQSQNQGRQVRVVNGLRVVNLRSSERSGDVRVRISDGSMRDELKIVQIAPLRPLIAVGLIEIGGHVFDRGLNSPMTSKKDHDARLAGFMKGRVRGDMHLTLSVDTSKNTDAVLFRDINPNKSYPIHGDSSQRGYEAQGRSKVYAKLEKNKDSILWGDFATDRATINEDVTRVQRSLTGANVIAKGDKTEWQFFVSEQDEERVVEQIRGKGVALNYRLTNVPLVVNSETIEIITVSRDNPGIVLDSKTLNRFGDYTLDSVTGELSFSETVPTSDASLNPVHIRASYDVEGAGKAGDYTVAGARLKHQIKPGFKVGLSYTVDQHDTSGFELYGATFDYKDDHGLIVRGSLGQYKPIDTAKDTGIAGRFHLAKQWENKSTTSITLGRATKGFTNSASGISEEREELRIKHELNLYKSLAVDVEAIHSRNLANNDTEQSVGVTANVKLKGWTMKGGVRHIEQNKASGDERFQTFIVGAKKAINIAGRAGSLEGEYEQDFDSTERRRIALTADMQVHEKVKIYAKGERINSLSGVSGLSSSTGAQDTFSVGVKSNLLPSTELFSEYRVRGGISGRDLETASGIRGTYELSKGLSVSPHFEVVKNLEGSGSDSVSASIAYKDSRDANRISALRLETRHDDSREYYGLQADYVQRLSADWSALFKDTLRYESPTAGSDLLNNTLTLGLAYRPRRENKQHALFFYQNKEERGGDNGDCSTHILSTHQNYEIKEDVLLSGRLGGKKEDCNGSESDAVILDGRLTWDLTNRLDVDVHAGVLGTNGLQEKNYSVGAGVNYLVRKNLRVGVGYNIKGFKDDDLDPDNFNDKGVYLGLKYKFDENSLNWLTGE